MNILEQYAKKFNYQYVSPHTNEDGQYSVAAILNSQGEPCAVIEPDNADMIYVYTPDDHENVSIDDLRNAMINNENIIAELNGG